MSGRLQAEARTHRPRRDVPSSPSATVLRRIVDEKVTLWGNRGQLAPAAGSLKNIDAIVVAPILDQDGEVTGALYTDRRHEAGNPDVQLIAEIEAKLVELIAQAVTVGLQRAEKDRTILAERARFEQFFTPELARILPERPEMLVAKDAEISVAVLRHPRLQPDQRAAGVDRQGPRVDQRRHGGALRVRPAASMACWSTTSATG